MITTSVDIIAKNSVDVTSVEQATFGDTPALSIDPRKSENWHGSSEDTIQDWKSTTHRYENKCRRERTNNRSYLGVAKSGVEMPKDVP